MRMTTDKIYYGNYRFVVEFDSGSETGSNQLTVWVAEKADIDAVPLKQLGAAQLLNALIEPERSRLHAKLEEEKRICQQPIELEIANLQHSFRVAGEEQGQKIPEKVKSALQRLEVEFSRQELWSLDRQCFNRDMLQAQSRVFGEEFSLRDFYAEYSLGEPSPRRRARSTRLKKSYANWESTLLPLAPINSQIRENMYPNWRVDIVTGKATRKTMTKRRIGMMKAW